MVYIIYILLIIILFLAIYLYKLNTNNKALRLQLEARHYFDQCRSDVNATNALDKVISLCESADLYLNNLNDKHAFNKLNECIEESIELIDLISDPVQYYSALSSIIKLAHNAGMHDTENELLGKIKDPAVMKQVLNTLTE